MEASPSPHTEHAAHMEKLHNLCRLCGKKIKGNKYLCKTLADKIMEVYNVNIENDLADIHPEYLCGPCRYKMCRKTDGNFLKPYYFEEHKFTGCMVCTVHRGRPNKRNSACISRSDKADAQSGNDDIAIEKRPCLRNINNDESVSFDREKKSEKPSCSRSLSCDPVNREKCEKPSCSRSLSCDPVNREKKCEKPSCSRSLSCDPVNREKKCEKPSCSRSLSCDPVNRDKYKKLTPSTSNASNTACKDISTEIDDVSFERVEVTGTPVEFYEHTLQIF